MSIALPMVGGAMNTERQKDIWTLNDSPVVFDFAFSADGVIKYSYVVKTVSSLKPFAGAAPSKLFIAYLSIGMN